MALFRGDYSGIAFTGDAPSGGAVIGNYTGADVFGSGVKGIGGAGRGGVFYTNTNDTCVYMNGGNDRSLLVNNSSGFCCIQLEGATTVGPVD